MEISVIGLGYLGVTHAVAMAKLGHAVIGVEPNNARLQNLRVGKLPFYEPGLEEALVEVLQEGRIRFQERQTAESASAEVSFICVGTPQRAGSNAADTTHVFTAGEELARLISPESLVVGKSTVPVGTAFRLQGHMSSIAGFSVKMAWNPEFLREGSALEDSLRPDRIVVGSWDPEPALTLKRVYGSIVENGTPFLSLDVPTAELVKVAANSFLATKISFINAMAEFGEVSGADTVALAEAIGIDDRIGQKFLRNGLGFGGGCLPKDIRAFAARAEELGIGQAVKFLGNVDEINLRRRQKVVDLAIGELGGLSGKKVTVLGVSFKPDSDDVRDSPSLDVALRLAALGAEVWIHDPRALPAIDGEHPDLIRAESLESAFANCELLIVGTEWEDYQKLDPYIVGKSVARKLVIDGRNVLDVAAWQGAGWRLIALGRNVHN